MKPYLYETHLHTSPVSKCARASVRESLAYYKSLGYAGVFITNHFLDGNVGCDKSLPYEEQIDFYFADYEEGVRIGREIGLPVFLGVECSYKGTDFLIYGLDKNWFLAHPESLTKKTTERLTEMAEAGALVIQAHPFREAGYIDHIRLFPRHVHGTEIYNAAAGAARAFRDGMAKHYAEQYALLPFAGSDNHLAAGQTLLAGMSADAPIIDERDFVARVKQGELSPFLWDVTGNTGE